MRMLKAKVYGKVQGVWFRQYTLDCADRIGLVGMVKNLDDGTVLIHAAGKNLRDFKKYLKSGPAGSNVERIEFSWKTFAKEFSEFKIEY